MELKSQFSRPPVRRWAFFTLIVLAIVIIGLTIRALLIQADMSLGLSRISGSGLQGLVVSHQQYTAPHNGAVKVSQIGLMYRIVTHLDTLKVRSASNPVLRKEFAKLLNSHTTGLHEYRWFRESIYRVAFAPQGSLRTSADSLTLDRLRMVIPTLQEHRRFFTDSLDKEAL